MPPRSMEGGGKATGALGKASNFIDFVESIGIVRPLSVPFGAGGL